MNKFLHDTKKYTAYRPQYPIALYEYLLSFIPVKNRVLDCGTGSGQAACDLANYFNYVVASDLSFDLLQSAPMLSNILHTQAKAEQLPLASQSIDLICVAQALHWFSLNEFYREVKRVLNPNGYIAAWCYNQCTVEPEIDNVVRKIYQKITSPKNKSIERKYLYDHYQTIPFPFKRINTPYFEIRTEWNWMELYGYIATWPGLLEYEKTFNTNMLDALQDEFISAWGEVETKKMIKWPIHLLFGQLHA